MTKDLVNNIAPVKGIAPATKTSTTLGSVCDTRGFESVIAAVFVGTYGDVQSGSVYMEAELQESADNVTYTAVADTDLLFPTNAISPTTNAFAARTGTATGTFFQSKTTAAADPAGLYQVGYRGSKRYLKINMRLTGSHSTGTPMCAFFERGNKDFRPSNSVYPSA